MENIQEKYRIDEVKIENIVDNPSLKSLFTNGKLNVQLMYLTVLHRYEKIAIKMFKMNLTLR